MARGLIQKNSLFFAVVLTYQSTPVQELSHHPVCEKAGIRLLVKREDMNHPTVSGNKWWKLKHNVAEANRHSHQTILTFGGAFSNHLFATAAAARETGLKSIGIVRGEETVPLNSTLAFTVSQGMKLHYISRKAYKEKSSPAFIQHLHEQLGDFYLVPEGGSNLHAIKGCAEFAAEHLYPLSFDHLVLPVGTGGTMAGIICGLEGSRQVCGISVLKGGEFLQSEVDGFIKQFSSTAYANWSILTGYDEGGYAKTTRGLLDFIAEMNNRYRLPLDHVYTGKLLRAALIEIEAGRFERGQTVLALHTGGLQGALR